MKLARLFLAVLAIGALAACGSTPTAPDAQPTGVSRDEAPCNGTLVTDPVTGVTTCNSQIGSGG
ncbi:MAG TPA: hypothetical protein VEY93_04985 [Longimicrobium sp.]|nr:hypothetical protein [Longimicrobium sp.]